MIGVQLHQPPSAGKVKHSRGVRNLLDMVYCIKIMSHRKQVLRALRTLQLVESLQSPKTDRVGSKTNVRPRAPESAGEPIHFSKPPLRVDNWTEVWEAFNRVFAR